MSTSKSSSASEVSASAKTCSSGVDGYESSDLDWKKQAEHSSMSSISSNSYASSSSISPISSASAALSTSGSSSASAASTSESSSASVASSISASSSSSDASSTEPTAAPLPGPATHQVQQPRPDGMSAYGGPYGIANDGQPIREFQ